MSNAFGALGDGTDANITGSGGTITVASGATVSGLQCTPSSLTSGGSSTCTVSLSQAAPSGGATVAISSNKSSLTVPTSVVVAAASTSATFKATATTISSAATATVTASYNGGSATANVSLVPASVTISGIACNPTSLGSNSSSTCTVTLSQSAPSGGAILTLSDNSPTLNVPTSVTVAAGQSSATFTASTGTVSGNSTATVTGTYSGSSATVTLSLSGTVRVSSLSCNPATIGPNSSTTCTVAFTAAAPSGGAVVTLSDTSSRLAVPTSVKIAAGATSGAFTASTRYFGRNQSSTLTASYQGSSARTTVNLVVSTSTSHAVMGNGPADTESGTTGGTQTLSALSCGPKVIAAGSDATCELTVSAASTPSQIALATSDQDVKAPSTVTPRANQTRLTFQVNVGSTAGQKLVTVTAGQGSDAVEDTIQVAANSQPVITAPRSQSTTLGSAVRFTVTATDASQQPVDLTANGVPAGATFDKGTGVFEWTPSQGGAYNVQFAARNQLGQSTSAEVSVNVSSAQPKIAPTPSACSPGAIGTLTGTGLTDSGTAVSDSSGNSPELAGARVVIDGQAAAVLSASSTEVQFVCPALPSGTPLAVSLATKSGTESVSMPMAAASPRIFTIGDPRQTQGAVSFSESSELAMARNFRVAAHPAQAGDEIVLWGTGLGLTNQASPVDAQVSVTVGGVAAPVVAVGSVPGHAGVSTVRVRVPVVPAFGGRVPVQLQVLGADGQAFQSNTVTISVEPVQQ